MAKMILRFYQSANVKNRLTLDNNNFDAKNLWNNFEKKIYQSLSQSFAPRSSFVNEMFWVTFRKKLLLE